MAQLRVFQTTELVELILSFFPFDDLLRAEQVCRRWKGLIATSRTLQENLFLEERAPNLFWVRDAGAAAEDARLTDEPVDVPVATLHPLDNSVNDAAEAVPVAMLHPLLKEDPLKTSRTELLHKEAVKRKFIAFTVDWKLLCALPQGRWQRMYLSQPPSTYGRIDYQVRGSHGVLVESRRFPDGFKLGMLATRLQELLVGANFGDTIEKKRIEKLLNASNPRIQKLTCYVDGLISENSPLVQQARTKTVIGQSMEEEVKK